MQISKEFKFESSHILPRQVGADGKPGKCSRLHGHSWRVVVEVEGDVQVDSCFILDYAELSRIVDPIVERFDHRHLNAFVSYPSSENIAIHIAYLLMSQMLERKLEWKVKVSETAKTWSVWDSSKPRHMAIISQHTLDSDVDKMDAEWRSPVIKHVQDIPKEMKEIGIALPFLWKQWEDAYVVMEQLALYKDSLESSDLYFRLKSIAQETKQNEAAPGLDVTEIV